MTFLGTVEGDVVALILLLLIRSKIGGNKGRSSLRAIRVPIMIGVLITSLPSGIRISSGIKTDIHYKFYQLSFFIIFFFSKLFGKF